MRNLTFSFFLWRNRITTISNDNSLLLSWNWKVESEVIGEKNTNDDLFVSFKVFTIKETDSLIWKVS